MDVVVFDCVEEDGTWRPVEVPQVPTEELLKELMEVTECVPS